MKTALVITSIAPPTPVLRACAAGCRDHGMDFILIGDRKSPADFRLEGCDYWCLDRQRESGLDLARLLPEGHYARKNLGYLIAMQRGAEVIIETDDDNLPDAGFWTPRTPVRQGRPVTGTGWFNPYPCFSDEEIWPRGFPLEELHNPSPPRAGTSTVNCHCPIQQGLADGDPDVDAVYRLTRGLAPAFRQSEPVAVGTGVWSPFNSQNTTWFREAFPLLYLPSFCSFRMTDIWRSFVAQRICQANGWNILFHSPTVHQERNVHDLLRDFADEVPGYLHNAAICRELAALDIPPGIDNIPAGLLGCYEVLVARGLVRGDELELLRSWLSIAGNGSV